MTREQGGIHQTKYKILMVSSEVPFRNSDEHFIGTACLAKSALCWFLEALCQGKQKKLKKKELIKMQAYFVQINHVK